MNHNTREIELPFRDRPYNCLRRVERLKVWATLLPYLWFPEDSERRKGSERLFAAKLTQKLRGRIQRRSAAGKSNHVALRILDLHREAYDGIPWDQLLAGAVSAVELRQNLRAFVRDCSRTFYLLWLMMRLKQYHSNEKGGPSLSKALAIAAKLGQNHNLGRLINRKRSTLEGSWSRYRNVSHLQVALFICVVDAKADRNIFDDSRAFLDFFEMAYSFQDFLLDFRPRYRSKPLVDPAKLWRIPPLAGIRHLEFELDPLEEYEKQALDEYKAPLKG